MTTTEQDLEARIFDSLVVDGGYANALAGPVSLASADGIYTPELLAFINATQSLTWSALESRQSSPEYARGRFFDRLASELDTRGTVDVLRRGIIEQGLHFDLAFGRPAHEITPEVVEKYDANRLTVVRQFAYEADSNKTVDLCLFVNGIPVATAELKNRFTGQTVHDAVKQYRQNRDPKNLTLGRRCVVHFAVDGEQVMMTTRLAGRNTRFLPFNKGHDGGAGNPPNPDGPRTSYLWEEVWQRDAWLDLLLRFVHQPKDGGPTIFPRYHQWDAVKTLEAEARSNGAGENYLIEHSAGSGKSNTIAWLAYRLSELHDADDRKVFDKVVVITDRVVLDKQLQDTIYAFEHQHGLVERIEKDSNQLRDALAGQTARIIITTLQKFPVVHKAGADLPDRRYAVIVDEAHSSQTGEAAKDLKLLLGPGAEAADELRAAAESDADLADPGDPLADALQRQVDARGRQRNLSFFAFTATPKERTLGLFGRPKPGGDKNEPFHVYSMRQAIEEEFILDVLANYTTYETYWNVQKKVDDDPRYDSQRAAAALRREVTLDDRYLELKAKTIVDHFQDRVAFEIDGRAKGMVVTSSRLHAVRYGLAIRRYCEELGIPHGTLVAFSGTVVDNGVEWTETRMNGVPESQTPTAFAGDDFRLMVVAEKYQTGFDQPLLAAMYVDKTLSGVAAVQTLSRLNRTHAKKTDTFVLDFRNDPEQIQKAFEPYFQTTVAEPPDPNDLHDTRAVLDQHDVLRPGEMGAVAEALLLGEDGATTSGKVHAAVQPATDRFGRLEEDEQDTFRDKLATFVRTYSYLSQIVSFGDRDLERDYLFCKALGRVIRREGGQGIDLGDEVELSHLRQELTSDGSIELEGGELEKSAPREGSSRTEEEEALSEIIARLNERHGAGLSDEDRLARKAVAKLVEDESLQNQAGANSREAMRDTLDRKLRERVAHSVKEEQEAAVRLLNDPGLIAQYADGAYDRARVAWHARSPIEELVAEGEGDHLEFKSTFRTGAETGEVMRVLEGASLKTIGAYLNSEAGGTLLVGVADDGSPVGLENDFASLHKEDRQDEDRFLLHIKEALINAVKEAASTRVSYRLDELGGRTICRVHVRPSEFPVWCQIRKSTKGGEVKHDGFFIRIGPSTVDLADRDEERARYIAARWPDLDENVA